MLAFTLLSYAAFLRFNEVVHLKRSDILFYDQYIKIFIESNKTDVYEEGAWVYIAPTFIDTCPVTMLQQYLKAVNTQMNTYIVGLENMVKMYINCV